MVSHSTNRRISSSVRSAFESLENRTFLSTTTINLPENEVASHWTTSGGDGPFAVPGSERDAIGDLIDQTGSTATFTVDLPEHTMINVVPIVDGVFSGGMPESVSCEINGVESKWEYFDPNGSGTFSYLLEYEPGNDGIWIADDSDSFSITFEASDSTPYAGTYLGVIIKVYDPTVTASGGGSLSEAGDGSGEAIFAVGRDLPAGYDPTKDEDIPDLDVTVKRLGSATFNTDYTKVTGYDDLPSGTLTFTGVQTSKSFAVKVIDDDIAEPTNAPTMGPPKAETIIWDVSAPDPALPGSNGQRITVTISDDSRYYYSAWNKIEGPDDMSEISKLQDIRVEEPAFPPPSGVSAPGVTRTTFKVFTREYWEPLAQYKQFSQSWGEAVNFNVIYSTTTGYSYSTSGSVGVKPVTIQLYNFQITTSTTTGVSQPFAGNPGGATKKAMVIPYIRKTVVEEQITVENWINGAWQVFSQQTNSLGSGVQAATFAKEVYVCERKWLDDESSLANGLSSTFPTPGAS